MNEFSSSYTSASSQSRHSCKFEKIAKDQQVRLQMIISQLESQKHINSQLKQQIELLKSGSINSTDKYINEIQNLKDKCQILETKNELLNKELIEARVSRKNSEDGLNTIESDNRRLIQMVEKKKNKISQLKSRISETQNYEQYVEKCMQLEEKLSQANRKNMELEVELKQSKESENAAKSELQEIYGQLNLYSKEISLSEIANYKDKMNIQECTISEKQKRIDELIKQTNFQNQKINTLERNNKRLELKQAKYKAYKKHSKDLLIQNEKLKSEIISYSSLSTQLNSSEVQIKSQQELIEKIRDENRNLKANIENGSISKLQGEYVDIRLERDSLMRDLSRLENKAKKINFLERENDELKQKNEELYCKVKEGAIREQKQSENINILLQDRKEIEGIKNMIMSVSGELDKYKMSHQILEEENKNLKNQILQSSNKKLSQNSNKEKESPVYNVLETKVKKITRKHSQTKHHKK